MIVSKITYGFVVQKFDTETRRFVGQEFVAGNDVEYADELGDTIFPPDELLDEDGCDRYLSFEMVQPEVKL